LCPDLTPAKCVALANALEKYLDLDPRSRQFFDEKDSLAELRAGRPRVPLFQRSITRLIVRLSGVWKTAVKTAVANCALDDQVRVARESFGDHYDSRNLFFKCDPSETPEQALALLRSHLPEDLVIDIIPNPPDFVPATR
jgi:hypothetical protein